MNSTDLGVPASVAGSCGGERPMVDSFTIRNFRSFREVKVEDCRRINIVVGDNGSGKTALLEALFLALGVSPELVLRTKSWRGHESGQMHGTQEDVHLALWGDLFHKFRSEHAATVSLKGQGEQDRSVSVWLNKQGSLKVIPPRRDRPRETPFVVARRSPIEFKWKIKGSAEFTIAPTFENDKLVFPQAPASHIRGSFHASARIPSSYESANRFSMLSKEFQEDVFIDKYKELYERIQHLSLEFSAGTPMLFASVESLPEKIPLSLASGGMSKLANLLLSITEQAGGVILVDEVENGFYYKRIPFVWNALLDFARFYNCQLFVSTHSEECLRAAAALAEKYPMEFSVIRTTVSQGESKVTSFGGERFAMAINEEMEVR